MWEFILNNWLAILTLVIVFVTFLSSITDWFKKTIPLKLGFRFDDSLVNEIEISTGDVAKPIVFGFHNYAKTTLTGVVVDMRFLSPITLSGTGSALSYIPGKTAHGRMPDKSFYHIRYSELDIVGHSDMDFRVELNTQGKSPGTYKIIITVYSTQQDYKYNKSELTLIMK